MARPNITIPERVRARLRDAPDSPGCYLMRDAGGRIVYVGKAVSLRKRVRHYFRPATIRAADPKLRGLLRSVADLEFVVVRTEAEATLTEGRLIKEYRPRYNVSFRDDKRFLMLRVDPREPFPRFELRRIRQVDGAEYFGPYASSQAARAALAFVEKRFGLRRCRPRVPGPDDHRHCIDDVVRYCSAPCVGKVDPAGYAERVREACAFLRGERPQVLGELRAAMEAAGAAQDFERAAALRDTWLRLCEVTRGRARVASAPAVRREDAREGLRELARVMELGEPPRVIEAYDVSNISGTSAVASMVCAVDGVPQGNRYRRFRIRTVEGSDDPAMIAETVTRRFGRLKAEGAAMPDLVLIDGGITQLRAARAALAALGLHAVHAAGLAKRLEEIYWYERRPPIRLPPDSKALLVLRRIRDEAHRFALDYHRRLRQRAIRESLLDNVPGIGEKRKQALLKRFGSFRRLCRASVEEIARAPGVGAAMAAEIRRCLDALAPAPGRRDGADAIAPNRAPGGAAF